VAAACLAALSACSSGDDAKKDSASGGKTKSSGKVKLTAWTGFTGGDRSAYEGIVKSFNDSHPNIEVAMEVQPWDTIGQKLPSAWATGQGPDLATPNFDPNVVAQYIKTNSVMPLDDAVGDGAGKINADKLSPSAIKAFTVDGKLYAVPANVATLQLYYNKKALSEAGIAEPPKTAEDFRAAAVKLTKKSGGKVSQYGLSLADHETIQMWPVLQWMEGGDIVDEKGCAVIDSPESVQSLRTWSDLVTKEKISPVGLTGAESDSLFAAGKAAMQINGPWAAAGYKKAGIDLGVAQVPAGSAGPVTLGSTVPLMVAKRTKNAEAAFTFLAYWTSASAQAAFAKASGFPPVRTDMADNADLASDPVVSSFAAALPNARLYLPGVKDATKVDGDVYVPLIAKITRGADVATEAKAAADKINSITGCSK
jgi:multiple sugar transport system substrate-binding protein